MTIGNWNAVEIIGKGIDNDLPIVYNRGIERENMKLIATKNGYGVYQGKKYFWVIKDGEKVAEYANSFLENAMKYFNKVSG